SMPDSIEELGFGSHGQAFKVGGPHFERITVAPFGKLFWIVEVPGTGNVMDRADEIIPGMAGGKMANPVFVAGDVIDFEPELDFELGIFPLRAPDFFNVFVELIEAHAPVVEIVPLHRAMVGDTDFGKADLERVCG